MLAKKGKLFLSIFILLYNYSFLYNLRRKLQELMELSIFGFNSARFDLPILLPHIVSWATKHGHQIECLKRGTSYITLRVGSLHFKDALNFNCPVKLEKFIK